jgi:class 3 adenylate cyclase
MASSKDKDTQCSLSRIEETLAALCAEVSVVRAKVEALEGANGQMTSQEVIDFLDGYRAAEAAAANAFGAWIAVSDTPCLRGGLRAVQMREGYHARLFEERIKELGGSPKAEMDEAGEAFLMSFGDDRSDAEKVDAFMNAAGDPKVLEQLEAQAARMNDDEETQFLLRSVIEDERASLALVKQAHEMLCES